MREHRLDRLAGVAFGGHPGDARLGMVVQQAQELDAGVAGRAQDADAHAVRHLRPIPTAALAGLWHESCAGWITKFTPRPEALRISGRSATQLSCCARFAA